MATRFTISFITNLLGQAGLPHSHFIPVVLKMQSWTATLNKTSHGLLHGVDGGAKGHKRTLSDNSGTWKHTLNEVGTGLLHGRGLKKEGSEIHQPLRSPIGRKGQIRISGPITTSTAPTSMVHNIPCFDLPVAGKVTATNYQEASLLGRITSSRSLREKKQIHISSPIHLWPEETNTPAPPPVEKDERYKRAAKANLTQSPLRSEYTSLEDRCTERDLSPAYLSNHTNRNQHTESVTGDPHYSSPPSVFEHAATSNSSETDTTSIESSEPDCTPISWGGKRQAHIVMKIPDGLPYRQRCIPPNHSQSTRVPVSRNTYDVEIAEDEDEQAGWTDCSSVYSQESQTAYEYEPFPR